MSRKPELAGQTVVVIGGRSGIGLEGPALRRPARVAIEREAARDLDAAPL